ncbi:MAG: SUMF1/EgtB/PvdO family nonheme iron enzyme [Gammaproteobacteria bacterium]|nr:SUMF1/EgtB/PvdO family nonheme iron enzyme [Gammaproteobacteria bacterium]
MCRTTAVGLYPGGRSKQGVYDLAGNVEEWCRNQ